MKKIGLLLSCFILLTAFTCENEPLDSDFDNTDNNNNNNNGNTEFSLVGDWTAISFEADVNTSMAVAGIDNVIESSNIGSNMDYNLTFTETTYTVNGTYDITSTTVVNGVSNGATTSSYDNVSGDGNYTANNGIMTFDGSFFEFEIDGVDNTATQGEQTANYSFSDDGNTLTISQNQTITQNTGGIDVTTITVGASVWTRVGSNNDPCQNATTAAEEAQTAYEADSTNGELCNAYVNALEAQITSCGDEDGSIQNIIDSLDCETIDVSSLIGTWRIVSLTSNGVEELQDELDGSGICYWHEVYTATTASDIEYSGDNCEDESIVLDNVPYELNGNILIVDGDTEDTVEIIELTSTTLKYRDVYTEAGVNYEDIYTYTKQ